MKNCKRAPLEIAERRKRPKKQMKVDFWVGFSVAVMRRRNLASRNDSLLESAAKSMIRAASSNIGREITRGILGSLFGKRR